MMSIKKIRVTDRRAKNLEFCGFDAGCIPTGKKSHILMVTCEATNKERKYIVTINKKGSVKARCNSLFSRFMSAITLGWYQSSSATQLEESLQTHQKEESKRQIIQQKRAEREKTEKAEAEKEKAERASRIKKRTERDARNAAGYKDNPLKVESKTVGQITRGMLQTMVDEQPNVVVPTLNPKVGSGNDQYNKFKAKEKTDKE